MGPTVEEVKAVERRLNDEKINNLNKIIDGQDTRLKAAEEIVSSWKTERRIFMWGMSALLFFLTTIGFGAYGKLSDIQIEMAKHNVAQVESIGRIKTKVQVIETRFNSYEKRLTLLESKQSRN